MRTTVSSKGQVVIPRELRDARGWKPGTVLAIEELEDGVLLRAVPAFARTTVDDMKGCLPYRGEAKSLEEMEEGIAAGARRSR